MKRRSLLFDGYTRFLSYPISISTVSHPARAPRRPFISTSICLAPPISVLPSMHIGNKAKAQGINVMCKNPQNAKLQTARGDAKKNIHYHRTRKPNQCVAPLPRACATLPSFHPDAKGGNRDIPNAEGHPHIPDTMQEFPFSVLFPSRYLGPIIEINAQNLSLRVGLRRSLPYRILGFRKAKGS